MNLVDLEILEILNEQSETERELIKIITEGSSVTLCDTKSGNSVSLSGSQNFRLSVALEALNGFKGDDVIVIKNDDIKVVVERVVLETTLLNKLCF